jgi:hypothetical protein
MTTPDTCGVWLLPETAGVVLVVCVSDEPLTEASLVVVLDEELEAGVLCVVVDELLLEPPEELVVVVDELLLEDVVVVDELLDDVVVELVVVDELLLEPVVDDVVVDELEDELLVAGPQVCDRFITTGLASVALLSPTASSSVSALAV